MADPWTAPEHPAARWNIDDLLVDPAVSFALKAVLKVWEDRDPVDAAHDARLLAEALERRADEALSGVIEKDRHDRGRPSGRTGRPDPILV